MHSLADAQCLLSQFVDDASGGLLRIRRCVGRTDLAEDLLFADHHGIEPLATAKRCSTAASL